MISNIRAIAFDLDNTLWDIDVVMARAERRLLDWLRDNYPRVSERFTSDDMRTARALLAKEEPHRAHDFAYLRKTCMSRHFGECGYDLEAAALATEIFYTARNTLDVFGDVPPALTTLKRKYVLGSLTNGNADLSRIGLAHYFSVSLSACDVGVAKPHPESFAQLLTRLEMDPHEVLYVGDDPEADVGGARSAGMRTVWMNRKRSSWPDDLRAPDFVVRDCAELVEICVR
jgi:putative hydrolase of the HAD superfamily